MNFQLFANLKKSNEKTIFFEPPRPFYFSLLKQNFVDWFVTEDLSLITFLRQREGNSKEIEHSFDEGI